MVGVLGKPVNVQEQSLLAADGGRETLTTPPREMTRLPFQQRLRAQEQKINNDNKRRGRKTLFCQRVGPIDLPPGYQRQRRRSKVSACG